MDSPVAYLPKLSLQKAHVFSDPGPSINPLSRPDHKDERHNSSDRPSSTIYAL